MLTSLKTFSRQRHGRIVFFLAKLLAFFLLFDYFFLFLIGASVEGGVYIPFLAETLNIPVFYRDAVLLMAGGLLHLLNYEYTIQGELLAVAGSPGILLNYSCYGFSLISLYAALILAYPAEKKLRIKFLLLGLAGIVTLNTLRVAALAALYTGQNYQTIQQIDHHMIFNIVVYLFIFGIFYRYVNRAESHEKPVEQNPAVV